MDEEAIAGTELAKSLSEVESKAGSLSRAREVSATPDPELMTDKESTRSAMGVLPAIWAVLKPYYKEKQSRCSAWGLVVANVFFTIFEVFAEWWISDAQKRYVNALQALDSRAFLSSIRFLLLIFLLRACLSALNQYLVQWAALRWRTYLTHRFLNKYISGIAFYRLLVAGPEDVDSPDQRIGEDIPRFCHASMSNLHSIVDGSFKIILFSTVLAQEEGLLVCVLGYAVLGQLILVPWFGRALMKWTTEVLAREAELRFTLVQVREHAESLAFYQGGARAQRDVLEVYKMVLRALYATLRWQAILEVVLGLYKWLADYLPIFWLWSGYFAGFYPLGSLVQATVALQNVLAGTTEILTNLDRLAGWAADSMRLHKLWIALEDVMQRPSRRSISIVEEDISDDSIAPGVLVLRLQGLSVVNPRTGGLLCSRLSLDLKLGESLLVAGLSGCGKSSLLRAIAGLWYSGTGSIQRVPTARCIFVPQRPYMVRGSLCDQVLYPASDSEVASDATSAHGATASSDTAIVELLTSLHLGSLLDRYGLHNRDINWEHTLSVGEQQRLAFARVLWHKPLLAFLDEVTSALDEDNEVLCYEQLRDVVGSCVSVGHRRTLKQFHHMMLQSRSDSSSSGPAEWEVKRISDLEAEAEEDQFQEEDEDETLEAVEEVAPPSRTTEPQAQHAQEEPLPELRGERTCSPCRRRCERLSAALHHVKEVIWITPCDWRTILAFTCFVAAFATLVYAIAIVTLRTSFLQRDLQTDLKDREEDSYLRSLQLLVPWTIANLLAGAAKGYVAKWGAFAWRTVITRHMVDLYTKDNKFYRLKMAEGDEDAMIDNPDQRIGQNVAQFCLVGVDLATSSWSTAVQLATLSGLMLVLDQQLFAFAMLWSLCAQIFALECFGGKLVDLTQHVVAQEADFRFALMRIRENSEAIAFYGGSSMEGSQVSNCYGRLQTTLDSRNLWHRIYWQFFRRMEETGRTLVPLLLTAPAYFSGELEYGELTQRADTCSGLIQASEVVLEHMVSDEESGLASITVDAVRIQELSKALEGDKDGQSDRASGLSEPFLREVLSEQGRIVVQDTLDVSSGPVALRLAGLQVQAPRTGVTLCSALDLELSLGESLLIRGRSGAGKTSILRAIAGLWDRGRGRVERPPPEECAFVPQKPLMIRGSLRQQLIYPNISGRGASDEAIEDVMGVVRLSNLLNHLGFDANVDWATTLSLGEQQRIAFARTLLQRPRLAFLDEASSGIDRETEKRCYQALQDRTACYVSVGHRSTLAAFHTRSLRPPPPPPPGAEPLSARWRLASLSIG